MMILKKAPRVTQNLGFPRIGETRELKKAVEAFWQGKISEQELESVATALRKTHWETQKNAGIDLIPSNDFSFYDQMLDTSCLLGNIPPRFQWDGGKVSRDLQFQIARGTGNAHQDCGCGEKASAFASEMTKWFDTNYHYIVPEFHKDSNFKISSTKPVDEFTEALELGIRTKPVLIGPLSYLYLGKSEDEKVDRLHLIDRLLPVFIEVLKSLAKAGAEWIQIDEPILALDLDPAWQQSFASTYAKIREAIPTLKIMLATYFGELRENAPIVTALPIDVLHIDLTRADKELDSLLALLPSTLSLSVGVVDGRNIWRNDFARSSKLIQKAVSVLGESRVIVAPSCSLLHSPVTLRHEQKLDSEIKEWLSFAEEKLAEVVVLAHLGTSTEDAAAVAENQAVNKARRSSGRIHRPLVKSRSAAVRDEDSKRKSPFSVRQPKQHEALSQPLFPTTTIGSFPQTADVRTARSRFKKGELTEQDYNAFLREKTAECIRFQEDLGLDVLVHGEFERNDMVEYFGENLEGFTFTTNGWVQSYGSRCVKPPIIFGDVARPHPMTVEWSTYAQSLTKLPMKGMLTGPITILQWSFVRDDQPRSETARQIGLAIRDEVLDLEAAGIRVIQIDEPALREGLPLRKNDWQAYLDWATEAFRLSAAGVRDETQIHTHMCYCEFDDVIESIASLDADVISIETSRSNMELLQTFATFKYPNEVGPGVWDIHSPRVPSLEEMISLLEKAAKVLPVKNIWVNPDCGLKTRGWIEVKTSLENLVAAAKKLRAHC